MTLYISVIFISGKDWEKEGLSMGDYDDFLNKSPGDKKVIAGICHAKGVKPKIFLHNG